MAQTRPYPELSFPGIFLGALQGVLMTAAFVYIALKLGFGLGGSTVAAIIGFTVLRGALRRKSIVENNINQTVASGINTASAGVVFTLPALLLLSVDDPSLGDFPIGPLIFSAIAGSLMGIVLIIPLRKQMVEFERLRFPRGGSLRPDGPGEPGRRAGRAGLQPHRQPAAVAAHRAVHLGRELRRRSAERQGWPALRPGRHPGLVDHHPGRGVPGMDPYPGHHAGRGRRRLHGR